MWQTQEQITPMPRTHHLFGADAPSKVLRGANQIADAVQVTLP